MNFFRTLLPFIRRFRPHLHWMLLGTLSGAIALAAAVGLLSLSGWFLSAAAFAGLTSATAMAFNFFYPSVGVRLFAFTRIIARYGERIISHDTTFRILKTLRVWFYESIEPLAPAYLSKYRSGEILNRIVSDIDALDNLYIRILSPSASAFLVIISTGVFLSLFDGVLSLAACGILIIAIVIVPWAASASAIGIGQNLNKIGGILRTHIIEGIQGLTDLIVFGAMGKHLERLSGYHRQMISLQQRMSYIRGLSNASISFLSGCAIWVVLFIGVSLVNYGKIPGEFLACLVLAVWAAFEAAVPLAHAFQHLGRTREAAERIQEITSIPPVVLFTEKSKGDPESYDIHFENIWFQYYPDTQPVIDIFNLRISHGRRTALVGETGCGKSTLVHLLTRTWDPTRGRICVGGLDLKDLTQDELRKTITVISQQAHIFNGTVADNLRIARPDAGEQDLFHALETVHLTDFVHSLPKGLDTWVGEGGQRLSGGQARRLALARAVLHDAPVWVLDEPTEGLDKITEMEVIQSLMKYTKNRTVLIITHRLLDFQKIDQVVLMDKGRIIASGSHRDLIQANDRYRKIVSKMA
jgi:ATP-binding cassette, subfamily C, bacterial CydC